MKAIITLEQPYVGNHRALGSFAKTSEDSRKIHANGSMRLAIRIASLLISVVALLVALVRRMTQSDD